MSARMFHHVWGANHNAHSVKIPCRPGPVHPANSCSWPLWREGDDGKCDWCRESDRRRRDELLASRTPESTKGDADG